MTHHQRILALGAIAVARRSMMATDTAHRAGQSGSDGKAATKPQKSERQVSVKLPLGDPLLSPDDVLDRIDRGLSPLILLKH